VAAQRVRQQAEPAAQVDQRRGVPAQQVEHARVQRVGAQLRQRVVVVVAVAERALGQEGAGDAPGGFRLHGPRDGPVHGRDSSPRATGSASCAQAVYIAAEGCRPSSASIAGLAPWARLCAVTSTKATPRPSQVSRATALKASSSRATWSRSRPDWRANGVTPQSGIDSTSTRSARPPANPIARSSRPANCSRYSSRGRPRYWLLTPMSRL